MQAYVVGLLLHGMDEWQEGQMGTWMDGWMDGCGDGWMDGWIDWGWGGCMHVRMDR